MRKLNINALTYGNRKYLICITISCNFHKKKLCQNFPLMNDSSFEFYNTESDLYLLYESIGPDKIMQDLEL